MSIFLIYCVYYSYNSGDGEKILSPTAVKEYTYLFFSILKHVLITSEKKQKIVKKVFQIMLDRRRFVDIHQSRATDSHSSKSFRHRSYNF